MATRPEAFDARVMGMVQGVGFRYSALRKAQGLGLCGWVRNEADGSVSVHAEGPGPDVAAFAEWLRSGPPGASVHRLDLNSCAPTGYYQDFTVDY